MNKRAISVTLDAENITWLKGRAGAAGVRSVSQLLDQLVAAARTSKQTGPSRSVVGSIDIGSGDPGLEHADAALRALFDASAGRPMIAREMPAVYRVRRRTAKRRG